jgi:3-hydroxyacyl-[acyl-carrier-protein] dehydratase
MPLLDRSAIEALLPHRPPILLLDRVDEFIPGDRLVASWTVGADQPCYRGLSGAYPIPLVLESFAQAAGLLWLLSLGEPAGDHLLLLAGLRDCRFSSSAFPGDLLQHVVRFGHRRQDAAYGMGETWVGDRRIATMGRFLAVRRLRAEVFTA